jgi:putative hydrolase of the HAD superfamily
MIDAIAFDWGGIFTEGTFDSQAHVDLASLYSLAPAAIEADYLELMKVFEAGAFDLPGFKDALETRLGVNEVALDAFRNTFLGAVRERPAMYDVVRAIPERFTLGMLSNNVPELCDRVRSDVRLERMDGRFVFSNEIKVRKPDEEAYAHLEDALAVPAAHAVFIDDAAHNIEAAAQFGFHTIHLTDMDAFHAQWRELLPDVPLPGGAA